MSLALPMGAAVTDGVVPDGATNTQIPLNDPSQVIEVRIANPNAQGTSLNTYTHFNVPSAGVQLNNQVGSNPNLSRSARTIINQVTSTNPTFFEGPLGVSGPKAHVLLANPNGIQVSGGRFINTGAAVLTTGTVSNLGSLGGTLDTLQIETGRGKITVGEGGLAGTMDSLNLISKELEVHGPIQNDDPRISSGINIVIGDSVTRTSNILLPGSVGGDYLNSLPGAGSQPALNGVVFDLDGGGADGQQDQHSDHQ